jgi:hypothetical protein
LQARVKKSAALIASILFLAIGTIGLAVILTFFHGTWEELIGFVIMISAVVGSGVAAYACHD